MFEEHVLDIEPNLIDYEQIVIHTIESAKPILEEVLQLSSVKAQVPDFMNYIMYIKS